MGSGALAAATKSARMMGSHIGSHIGNGAGNGLGNGVGIGVRLGKCVFASPPELSTIRNAAISSMNTFRTAPALIGPRRIDSKTGSNGARMSSNAKNKPVLLATNRIMQNNAAGTMMRRLRLSPTQSP